MRHAVVLSFPVALVAAGVAADEGTWRPEEPFAQVNVFCTRVYSCGPTYDILHSGETKVISTSPKAVPGVCSAGVGPADSCNECLTNPPPDKCEWHLGPK
jgi:hypothetical protein